MSKKICSVCEKEYEGREKSNSTSICYDCALNKITGGNAPEQGDFNTASVISDETSDADLQLLMKDLRNVELGRSTFEPYDEDSNADWEDPAWCYRCNRDTAFCECEE